MIETISTACNDLDTYTNDRARISNLRERLGGGRGTGSVALPMSCQNDDMRKMVARLKSGEVQRSGDRPGTEGSQDSISRRLKNQRVS